MLHIHELICAYVSGPETPVLTLNGDRTDSLASRCQAPNDEFQRLFCRLYERLSRLQRALTGSCCAQELSTSVIGLLVLERLVGEFQALLDKHKHKTKHLLVRFATKRSTLNELETLHREVETLFAQLGLVDDWRDDWVADRQQMYNSFQDHVQNPHKAIYGLKRADIVEALAILRYEVLHHKEENSSEQVELMRSTFMKVVRCSDARVPKIPKFFIPSIDVKFGTQHEEIEGTVATCVVSRGVWDRETRLVAQYLSLDPAYPKSLFLRVTETWYGLEHQNVVKMLGASHLDSKAFVVWEDDAAYGNFLHYFSDGDNHEAHQRRLWRMFLQVAHGLHYIHQQGRTHGNMKCSHILVADGEIPKICHFELSREAGTGVIDRWKSPEYNLGTGPDPSKAGDVYAFGLCIIEARTNEIPYGMHFDDAVVGHLERDEFYPRPEGIRDDEWAVIKQFCAHNPEDRPSMAQAIKLVEELARKEAMEEEDARIGTTKTT